MVTAHVFVSEVVASKIDDQPNDMEKLCQIAVQDQVDGITARDARRAVLAVHAAMAWHMAGVRGSATKHSTTSDSFERPATLTRPSGSSG